jgi:hypothetical protein
MSDQTPQTPEPNAPLTQADMAEIRQLSGVMRGDTESLVGAIKELVSSQTRPFKIALAIVGAVALLFAAVTTIVVVDNRNRIADIEAVEKAECERDNQLTLADREFWRDAYFVVTNESAKAQGFKPGTPIFEYYTALEYYRVIETLPLFDCENLEDPQFDLDDIPPPPDFCEALKQAAPGHECEPVDQREETAE